jgi:hypothetical protein
VALEHGLFGSATATAEAALHGKPVRHLTLFKSTLAGLIQEGIEADVLSPEDPARLTRFLGGTVRGLMLGALQEGISRIEEEASIIVRLFLYGAGRRQERRKR